MVKAVCLIESTILDKYKANIVLLGEGSLKQDLLAHINSKGYAKYFDFRGYVDNKYVPYYYTHAQIFVICSHFEGTPIALLQAMYHGLAIAGTNVQGINSVIINEKNGLLTEDDDHFQMAETIKDYLTDLQKAKDYGLRARQIFQNCYDFSVVHARYLEILNA